jgi:tetratricopeptide (TPR) repeat protein
MKNFKMIFATAISLLSLQAMAQTTTPGFQLYEMNQMNKAKKVLLTETRVPGNLNSWFYLGKIYYEEGKVDSAKYCFDAISAENPKSTLATIGSSLLQGKSGQKSQAIAMLDKSFRPARSAKDLVALMELASARYMIGDTSSWKESLDAAISIKKWAPLFMTYGDIYAKLGELYPDKGYHGKAASQYQQVIYFDQKNLAARSKLAELYIRGMNYDLGEQIIKEILAIDSTYIPGLKQAGEYYYSIGKYPLACYYYNKYLSAIEPTSKDLGRYTTFLFFNKEYDKVGSYVNQVLQKEPDNAVMLRLKGYSSYELGKYDDGLQAMTKFFSLRAGTDNKIIAGDYEYYGKLLIQNHQEAAGVENLKKAMELDPTKINLYEDIAKAYDVQKNYLGAIDVYDKYIALKKSGTSGLYFRKGADLLSYVKSLEGTADSVKSTAYLWKADSAFAKVCDLSPSSHIGYWMRAQVGALLDKDSKLGLAKPYYEKALALAEPNPTKNKDVIVQSCWYLGSYYYTKWDESKTAGDATATELLKTQSLTYWNKLIVLDPTNIQATTALTELNK